MKKKLLVIITIMFFLIIIFNGCFEDEEKTESEKFVGKWTTEDSEIEQFVFYSNGTCLLKTYGLDGTYTVTDDGYLIVHQKNPSKTYTYRYQFGNNNQKLTLSDQDTYNTWVFRKQ